MDLLSLLMKKTAKEHRLIDIVDKRCQSLQDNEEEMLRRMKTVIWCLQGDPGKRPSISEVVQVVEGIMDVELDLVIWSIALLTRELHH